VKTTPVKTTPVKTTPVKTTTTKKVEPSNNNNIPYSTSDECGENIGRCRSGCCSRHGWCGETSEYCQNGCQPLYGICW